MVSIVSVVPGRNCYSLQFTGSFVNEFFNFYKLQFFTSFCLEFLLSLNLKFGLLLCTMSRRGTRNYAPPSPKIGIIYHLHCVRQCPPLWTSHDSCDRKENWIWYNNLIIKSAGRSGGDDQVIWIRSEAILSRIVRFIESQRSTWYKLRIQNKSSDLIEHTPNASWPLKNTYKQNLKKKKMMTRLHSPWRRFESQIESQIENSLVTSRAKILQLLYVGFEEINTAEDPFELRKVELFKEQDHHCDLLKLKCSALVLLSLIRFGKSAGKMKEFHLKVYESNTSA